MTFAHVYNEIQKWG